MEITRNSDGFIDISSLIKQGKAVNSIDSIYKWYIDGKLYFYKEALNETMLYYELIAEELAKDYKIPCAHYDLAILDGMKGIISEDILDNKNYYYVYNLLDEFHNVLSQENSLLNIWNALDFKYKNPKLTEKLMDQLVNIFIFDILIANRDRNSENLIIEENNGDVNFLSLIDNEGMLSTDSINYQEYGLIVGSQMDNCSQDMLLNEFLNESDNGYTDLLESKLWIISDQNINSVLNRVEERIKSKIPDKIKMDIKEKFRDNRNMIEREIDNKKIRKMR